MSVLNPVSTTPVPARRPTEDEHGNKVFASLGTLDAVMALGPPARQTWRAHGDRYVQDGTVFVRRGSDLKAGDEIQYGGYWYTVVGQPRGDQDHPFTGDDFGWVAYTLAGGG
jgi:hypothetical protein